MLDEDAPADFMEADVQTARQDKRSAAEVSTAVEGATARPVKKPVGRPVQRVLLDASHPLHTLMCPGCMGTSYRHSSHCKWRRQMISDDAEFARKAGLSPAEVEEARENRLLPSPTVSATDVPMPTTEGPAEQGSGAASSSGVPARSETVAEHTGEREHTEEARGVLRPAEPPAEEDERDSKFQCIGVLWGTTMWTDHGKEENPHVDTPFETNELQTPQTHEEAYQNIMDEDTHIPLDPVKIAAGVQRELKFMMELELGRPCLCSEVPKDVRVWSTRWVHRAKGEDVRSRFVARQFRDSQSMDETETFANTPIGLRL
eukprot:6486729-Amphidinium_carterae.1